jgi:hypothetical protein
MSANPAEILLRSRRVTGADLSKLRSEHDAYEAMLKRANRGCAGASCRQGASRAARTARRSAK